MAPLLSTSAELAARERRLLNRLLSLYGEQERLYGEVLDLSREQRDLIREGVPLGRIRGLLAGKKSRLETISRMDVTEAESKDHWRRGRSSWSAGSRARLHRAIDSVGRVIEDILACEEENDRELLHQSR